MDKNVEKTRSFRRSFFAFFFLFLGVVFGFFLRGCLSASPPLVSVAESQSKEQGAQLWTCSMHPQIIQDKPGKCPICFMDLVPVVQSSPAGPRQIEYTGETLKLMDVETARAERKEVEILVNMVGKVDYDESRIRTISAWVPGRIDRLYADTVGVPIQKGEHLVELYSPELISSQAEFLQALQSARQNSSASGFLTQSVRDVAESAREKLRLLGLQPEQIRAVEESGKVMDYLTIFSPIGGVVIEKYAQEGVYVQTGQPIYKVADLSKVWIRLDAYESDLPWVTYGQPVEFTAAAYPGRMFQGRISFVEPFLNPKTRTVKLRVIADNPEGLLKPEMLVHAHLRVRPDAAGQASVPEMAGKWLCPMHPDVVRDEPGPCPVCGMNLLPAENLGIRTHSSEHLPLVVPASSVLWTGKRAVVYVKLPDKTVPTFEGREITLGPRAGDYYLVEAGLEEGEEVAAKGAYRIDADLQIQAKPSMMNPEGAESPSGHSGHSGHSI